MDFIIDAITEWIKDFLIEAITGNLSNMFGDVNTKVATIAGEVGKTPEQWNSGVFSMIHSLSESVIVPIAGLVIAAVLSYELIRMVIDRNNMHDFDTIITENENVFYLVIDKQRDTENVYFLNAVTESDLMALAEPDAEETAEPVESEPEPTPSPEPEEPAEVIEEPEPEPVPETGTSPIMGISRATARRLLANGFIRPSVTFWKELSIWGILSTLRLLRSRTRAKRSLSTAMTNG